MMISRYVLSSALFCGLVACNSTPPANTDAGGEADGDGVALGGEITVPDEGAVHVEIGTQVTYVANPPASGSHWPAPTAPGFYETAVEEEEWVHNLEHGYVVVLFDCRGECEAGLLDSLRNLVANAPVSDTFGYVKIVVTPYDGLPEPALITAVAWTVQMHLDQFDEQALLDFYTRHLDQGPELAP